MPMNFYTNHLTDTIVLEDRTIPLIVDLIDDVDLMIPLQRKTDEFLSTNLSFLLEIDAYQDLVPYPYYLEDHLPYLCDLSINSSKFNTRWRLYF